MVQTAELCVVWLKQVACDFGAKGVHVTAVFVNHDLPKHVPHSYLPQLALGHGSNQSAAVDSLGKQ